MIIVVPGSFFSDETLDRNEESLGVEFSFASISAYSAEL
jgi:hypothetical protein